MIRRHGWRTVTSQQYRLWRDRGLVVACLLILTVCVTHQFLMVSEQHIRVMMPLHYQRAPVLSALPQIAIPVAHEYAEQRNAGHPHLVLNDCTAQQAIVPFLLWALFLLVASIIFSDSAAATSRATLLRRGDLWTLPYPLAPSRRRALLQVFLN